MSPASSNFAILFDLDLAPPRLGLFKPSTADIFRHLDARSETIQSWGDCAGAQLRDRLNQVPLEELERDLKLAKAAKEYRKTMFDLAFELFRQVISSSFLISICTGITFGALGISSWLSISIGLAIAIVGAFSVIKLYLQANLEYRLWFQSEVVAEILQGARDRATKLTE